ncbi:hypothetical protein DSO57_1002538 [Entomophthora muscae]|uniref:Uncharacterized protein n=1 Tax=Entomophthora muscae TaxID=34485 RepID=A0ACC2T8K8_9FUNG|nr:hypothetical protein DSO57_1002538 [Entomophthora muscae]
MHCNNLIFVLAAATQARPAPPRTDIEPKDASQVLVDDVLWETFIQNWQSAEAPRLVEESSAPHPQAFFALSNAFFRSGKEPTLEKQPKPHSSLLP